MSDPFKQDVNDISPKEWAMLFPNHPNIQPHLMSGGLSGAILYRVNLNDHDYLVRRSSCHFGEAGLIQEHKVHYMMADLNITPNAPLCQFKNRIIMRCPNRQPIPYWL